MPGSILVADDDTSMLSLYNKIFSRTDYTVSMAESCAEAIKLINSNDYDLLITDLVFPDGLGTELIKAFREKKSGAKSFLVTGSDKHSSCTEAAGAAMKFEKPFSVESLLSAVHSALS
jgi:DNA-binding NtrC family response regulator